MPDDEPTSWLPTKGNTFDSLLDIVHAGNDEVPPWRSGYALELSSYGGLKSFERRHIAVSKTYASLVNANLIQNVSGDYLNSFSRSSSYSFARDPLVDQQGGGDSESDGEDDSASNTNGQIPSPSAEWGTDKLTVQGTSTHKFKERLFLMTGTIHRHWVGGIVRLASMEGVICGGLYTRVMLGGSMHLSPLMTGDVYGASARVSVARSHVAGFGYRSCDIANWAAAYYARITNFTIVPAVGTKANNRVGGAKKWAGKITMGLLPFLEILIGILSIPVALVALIFKAIMMIANKIRGIPKKPPAGPAGPPRALNRQCGITQSSSGSVLHT